MKVNFVCVRVGDRYGPEYVDILVNMLARNATLLEHDCAFWCITDKPDELPEGVYAIPADPALPGFWQKVRLFAPDMPWEAGDRCVYFDLDVAITGRLEDLVETPGVIRDWHWPMFNSSVMVWSAGEHREVWDRFTPERMTAPSVPAIAKLLPAGQINGGDQEWLTEVGGWDTFPPEWFRSYRDCHAWPPTGCKAVIFHGDPKPAEITSGWVPNIWSVGGLTSLPEITGANTSQDERLDNVRVNAQRNLPWFSGFPNEGKATKAVVLVCGAPSMKACIADIRAHKRWGRRIVSVNNAWRTLVEAGVTPDVHVMLDARPQNAEFIKGMPKSMRLLLASQVHPSVVDAALAEGLEVIEWHNAYTGGNEIIREILAPWWDAGPNQRPCILVPGGSTVGLRSLWLAAYSGFRTIHVYGMDSSYAQNGSHHAYDQHLNDQEQVIEVVRGDKRYKCAMWMTRQATEFEETWRDLLEYTEPDGTPSPVTIHVHGVGLIPDIARDLRKELRDA